MPLDPSIVGASMPPITMTLEPGRLQAFARAVGETNPCYMDLPAAVAAGHPGLLVPPTFLFNIEQEQPDALAWLTRHGVDVGAILHGEQRFTYHRMAYSGETVTAFPTIVDHYQRKHGALQFVVKETAILRDDGAHLADLQTVVVVRETEVAA